MHIVRILRKCFYIKIDKVNLLKIKLFFNYKNDGIG